MPSLNITNIPAPRVPFIDERTGLMARDWYRFFLNLFVLTGSGNNPITLEELQIGPPNQPDLAELLIQINQNIAPQYEDQSGDFLATLDTAQLMSMMARFENAEAAIQGAYLQPVVQTGTIANYNLDNSPTAGGIAYGTGPALAVSAAGTLGQVLTSAGAGTPTWAAVATGTVSSVSVVSANGLAGTVATATTTPAVTLSTTVTGVLKGDGTAISAATSGTDYAPATSGTSILYGNGSGGFNNVTIGTGVAFAAGTLSATGSGGTVTSVTGTAPVVSSGGTTPAISLATAYGDTLNPYASKTANFVLAAPNGSAGVPTFRAVVAADVPTLNQNTTGNAATVTTNANLTGPITSTGNATAVAAQTGTGSIFVMQASPSLTTPDLGTPSAGTVTNLTGTASININGTVGATTAATGAFTTLSATGVSTFADGTVALPSITNLGDTNTGVYFPVADTVGITTAGAESMRSSQGVLRINTASNANPVSFSLATASANRASISIANSSSDLVIKSEDAGGRNAGIQFWTGNASAQRMRINSSGNVGIGTASPSASAILDAQSTTKGVRMPNMTTAQKNAIAAPAAGLMVYDTTLAKLCVYTTAWETITSV